MKIHDRKTKTLVETTLYDKDYALRTYSNGFVEQRHYFQIYIFINHYTTTADNGYNLTDGYEAPPSKQREL